MFALVDCNNFYASCEKLFRPDITHRPVVVLSNNDGCVVARSKEAKALGIKMGVPVFQVKPLIEQYRVLVFSSNYALYADMSARVMTTLEHLAPRVEVYSIDESFLDLSGMTQLTDLTAYGLSVKQQIQNWVGLTVCVGIAPSKTLAKLANHAAKTWPATQGVVDLTNKIRQRKLMALLPVNEVWGVGRKITERLNAMGISTALQLADACPKYIRKQFSVVLERTVHELNGTSCLDLETITAPKKQIISSRSFGERITDYDEMHQAICEYVCRACEKLRLEKQEAKLLSVFIRTSPFHPKNPYYSNQRSASLVLPSQDSRDFIELASRLLRHIWKDGYRYAKAGVMLTDFYPSGIYQPSLFDEAAAKPGSKALMKVLDHINHSGKGKLWFAGQGMQQRWQMKREKLSPAYTTRWSDLPIAK
ncbi:MAG: translesion error-prone DNA polymerase V subunit UmuC [Opitutales bacterium]|nr:translesion error-prone DNA polymerase V subunit UmuC [Opitutales bacterium]